MNIIEARKTPGSLARCPVARWSYDRGFAWSTRSWRPLKSKPLSPSIADWHSSLELNSQKPIPENKMFDILFLQRSFKNSLSQVTFFINQKREALSVLRDFKNGFLGCREMPWAVVVYAFCFAKSKLFLASNLNFGEFREISKILACRSGPNPFADIS